MIETIGSDLIGVLDDALVEIRLAIVHKIAVWWRHTRKSLMTSTTIILRRFILTDLSPTHNLKRVLWILGKNFLLFHVVKLPTLILTSWCRINLILRIFGFVCEVDVILGWQSGSNTLCLVPQSVLRLLRVILRCSGHSQGLIILIILNFTVIHLDWFLTHLLPATIRPRRSSFHHLRSSLWLLFNHIQAFYRPFDITLTRARFCTFILYHH